MEKSEGPDISSKLPSIHEPTREAKMDAFFFFTNSKVYKESWNMSEFSTSYDFFFFMYTIV
jgi:hypothetical protein